MLDRKISLKIDAAADGAVKEIKAVEAAQDRFKQSVSQLRGEARKAKAVIGDVKAYEQLQQSLKHVAGDIEYTSKAIDTLNAKTKQKNQLTDQEIFKLEQHQRRLEKLNAKLAQKGSLTDRENEQLLISQREVAKLTKKRDSHYKLTVKEQKQLDSLTKKLSGLSKKQSVETDQLAKQEKKLKAAGLSTSNLSLAKDVANRRAQKSIHLLKRENELLARSTALQEKNRAVAASMPDGNTAALALLAGGVGVSMKSMDNEANFVDVAKNFDFASAEDKQAMRTDLNKLAQKMTGVNSADVMAIAAGGANGGVKQKDIATYTEDTIKTATAWEMSAEDSARKGMALRNSLSYADGEQGRDQFLNMANMINDVANKNGGVYGRDLLGVMSRSGADLINKGFTESGALSLSGALLSKGSSEEEAATATRGISRALAAGFSATGSQNEIYDMLGMDAVTVAESMQSDAMGALSEVLEGIKDLDASDQAAAVSQLFGEEAAPHVQKLLKDTKVLKKIQAEAQAASKQYEQSKLDASKKDSITQEYDNIAATKKAGWEETTDALSNFAVVLGDRLLPVIEPLREGFTSGVVAVTDFLAVNEGLGTAIAAGAVAVTGAVAAYKVYNGLKFVKGLAGIAQETIALKKAQSATDKHTAALERNARASNKAAANESGGGGYERRSRRRGRGRGKWKKRGLLGLGLGALSLGVSSSAFAGGLDGAADATGAATDLAEALPMAKAMKAAKFLRPVAMAMDGVSAASSLMEGDYKSATETGGGFLGGMGGAALGGAIGSFIMPGVGTAIGAALGGMVGDMAGTGIAGGVFDWFSSSDDKKKQLATVSADISKPDQWYSQQPVNNQTQAIGSALAKEAAVRQTPSTTFAPQIILQGTGNNEQDAEALLVKVRQLFDQWQSEQANALHQTLSHSLVS